MIGGRVRHLHRRWAGSRRFPFRPFGRPLPPGGPPSEPPPGSVPPSTTPAGPFAHLTAADLAWLAAAYPWLRQYAPSLGVRPADAGDVAQRAILVAARRWASFEASEEVPPNVARRRWIWQILIFVALDHRREKKFDRHVGDVEAAESIDASAPSPEGPTEARSVLRALRAATTAERWRVWLAHHVDGMSISQVARAEGIPPGTVQTRLQAARADLLGAIQREDAAARGPAVDRTRRRGAKGPRRKG